jgi:hypothetical protein
VCNRVSLTVRSGRTTVTRATTSSGTPTSPSARPRAVRASQAACSPPAATSSTTPARSSSISFRSSRTAEAGAHATIDGYDRSDGRATLSAAQPFQAADRLPPPPLRGDGPDLLARRATRRSGHRRARAAPATAKRRRRHRIPRATAVATGDRARPFRPARPARHDLGSLNPTPDQRQSASSATPAAVSACLRSR